MTPPSPLARGLLRALPLFKGSWLLHARMFKLLGPRQRLYALPERGIVVDLSDPPQFSAVKLRGGILEPATTRFIEENLRPSDVFIDVGANWGYFTCVASAAVGPAGLVVAIEPFMPSYRQLLRTISRNGVECAIPIHAAAGDRMTSGVSMVKPWFRQSTGAVPRLDGGPGRMVALDWVVSNIDVSRRTLRVIKIDVEGTELAVLRGARGTLEGHAPKVVVECAAQGAESGEVFELMASAGYEPKYFLDESGPGEILPYASQRSGQLVFERAS